MKKITRIAGITAAAMLTVGVQAAPHPAPPPRDTIFGLVENIVRICRNEERPERRDRGPAHPAPARHEVRRKAQNGPHHR